MGTCSVSILNVPINAAVQAVGAKHQKELQSLFSHKLVPELLTLMCWVQWADSYQIITCMCLDFCRNHVDGWHFLSFTHTLLHAAFWGRGPHQFCQGESGLPGKVGSKMQAVNIRGMLAVSRRGWS